MQKAHRIFVSHSHSDNVFGVKLVEDLRQTFNDEDAIWYDVRGGLAAGDIWWSKIVEELTARPIFIVVLSPDALESRWVRDEIALALQQKNSLEGKVIIPILYRPCKMPEELKPLRSAISFLPPKTYVVAFGEVLTALERPFLPANSRRITRRVALGAGLALGATVLAGAAYALIPRKTNHKIVVQSVSTPVAPRLRWRAQTDTFSLFLSSLTVVNGVVYVGDDNYVYAFDANRGTLLWRSDAANGASTPLTTGLSSPAVAGGIVYISSEDHRVYALDASTGNFRWKYQTGKAVESTPAFANGVVYIASEDHYVYALDALQGMLLWRYKTGNTIDASPAVSNGVVYIASEDRSVYALDALQGMLLWRYQTGDSIDASPIVSNRVVYIASGDGYIYALDASHGRLIWRSQDSPVFNTPAVASSIVYASAIGDEVYAIDARSGHTLWHHRTAALLTSPTVVGDIVYISSSKDGNVYALNAHDGAFLWRYEIGSSLSSPPMVVNNVLYVSSGDNYVYVLDV